MKYYTNKSGCEITAIMNAASVFSGATWQESLAFCEAIKHKLITIMFEPDRAIYIEIFGSRNLQIPKKCKTLQDVAEWINSKEF